MEGVQPNIGISIVDSSIEDGKMRYGGRHARGLFFTHFSDFGSDLSRTGATMDIVEEWIETGGVVNYLTGKNEVEAIASKARRRARRNWNPPERANRESCNRG